MYRRAASAHLDATIQGNVRVTNNHAKVIVKCYRELRVRGETAQKIFITLLSDPNEGVRLWAGKHALEFAPQLGEAVLSELEGCGSNGIVRINAHYILEGWHNGTLNFP